MAVMVFVSTHLQPFQLLMPNGSIFGAGTDVNLTGITGLRDMVLRSGDVAKGARDGSYAGFNHLDERVVDISYQIIRPTGTAEDAIKFVAVAHQNVTDPSQVVLSGGDYLRQVAGFGVVKPVYSVQIQLPNRPVPLVFFGRPVKYQLPIDQNYQYQDVTIATEWVVPDGLLYDTQIQSDQCGLPNPQSGLVFPVTFPATFGLSSGGSLLLNNTGAYPSYPLFIINGPCRYPTITNQATGEVIELNLVLNTGDVVMVDCQSGNINVNNVTNRNDAASIGSTFFQIQPGPVSVGFSSADGTASAGTLTGYVLPAYSVI